MSLLTLIQKRCSIRNYLPDSIPTEKLEYILESARLAPSAVNYQPWNFLVITTEEGRKKVYECYPREWIKPTPTYIVICGDHSKSWKRASDGKDHLDIDAGIVTEHICLAATELNIASCIVCNFDTHLFRNHFNLPEHVEPITIIPLAYPADPELFNTTPKKRKPLEDIIIRERF